MRRQTGQRALYEAWSRSRGKPKRTGILERLRPQLAKLRQAAVEKAKSHAKPTKPAAEAPPPATLKPPKSSKPVSRPAPSGPDATPAWMKSKAVQLNDGRVEVSVSYQIAIAAGLFLILIMLVAFKLGQLAGYGTTRPTARPSAPAQSETPTTARQPAPPSDTVAPTPRRTSTSTQGDHWIVLAYHHRYADLEAAKLHFANNGIDTEIFRIEDIRRAFLANGLDASRLPPDGGFLLVTSRDRYYENPKREGSDGYVMKEKIKEVGASYEPPPGLESFAPNRFSDAYGMKVTK